ncbi:MAG TPA: hypothetical protein VGP94_05825 [Tepidisphaeraceae bacterium]|jgi:hypothetical protein|nr:hypothetical protein [Tepidisphaeraceae bacterium]
MRTFLSPIDNLLRGNVMAPELGEPAQKFHLRQLLLLIVMFGLLYGAVMGSYGGVFDDRWKQVIFSAVKVPFLLLGTFLLSLPSFFVISSLLGLREDFAQSLRVLIATQAALTIILASLAPFTAVWYLSFSDYQAAVLFNAIMFGISSIAAQVLLRRFYAPLIARNPRHRLLVRAWLFVYAFVGIQMGWLLRPFIGDPLSPTRFFREHAWGNAYEVVLRMVWSLMSR